MMSIFEKLLRFYNFTDKDYEDFVGFIDDSSFPRIVDENSFNMIKKLKECIESGKKIIISGDYDCDGITSTYQIKLQAQLMKLDKDHSILRVHSI